MVLRYFAFIILVADVVLVSVGMSVVASSSGDVLLSELFLDLVRYYMHYLDWETIFLNL